MADRRTCLLLAAAFFLATGRSDAKRPLLDSRATFVGMVKDGRFVAFDEARGTVTFRPIKTADTPHEPGPMEDEVMASAVRAAAAEDTALRGLKVAVECRAGSVKVNAGSSATAGQTAELIQLALNEEGVRQVNANLPKGLRSRAAGQF